MKKLGILLLSALALSACAKPEVAVRPLISLKGKDLAITKFDDDSLHARLERLVGDVKPVAVTAGGWGKLSSDLINPAVLDVVFSGADRPTLNFGYGDAATSMVSSRGRLIMAMAGDSGSCWGLQVSGPVDEPLVRFNNKFAPNCTAGILAKLPADSWQKRWPATAKPPESVSATTTTAP